MKNCSFCRLTKEDEKFLLLETDYFKLFLADRQDYAGRCIIISKRHCESLWALSDEEWLDLKKVVDITEKMCKKALGADLCNWSCLMNDAFKIAPPNPHLHFHIRPRFKKPLRLGGIEFLDEEFGHHYDNHKAPALTREQTVRLFELCRIWIDNFLATNKK